MPIIECWCESQISSEHEGWLMHHADGAHTFVPDCEPPGSGEGER
jgi:hypothetical protein